MISITDVQIAIGKQTSKKVEVREVYDLMREQYIHEVNCPCCKYNLTNVIVELDKERILKEHGEFYKHCIRCGQKLDWGE